MKKLSSIFICAFAVALLVATGAHAINLTALGTPLNSGIGIDHSDHFDELIMSVNYSNGLPYNFERVASDGSRTS